MNQSQPSVAGGFAGWADCHAANGEIGYQNIKTVTLDASNKGVRYTPVGASSIDKKTINPIALCAIPTRARGQFGTQDTPEAVLSENSDRTHVTHHCARPARRPLRVEYHTSRATHTPCAAARGWVGKREYDGRNITSYYEMDSTSRSIYAGEVLEMLGKTAANSNSHRRFT